MNLVRFFLRGSWRVVLLGLALGLLSGACNAGLLAVINFALNNAQVSLILLIGGFVGLGLTRVATAAVSQYLLSCFAQQAATDLRRDLCQKILHTPLRRLEGIGAPRLLVALTEDVIVITMALRSAPSVIIDLAMLLGCFVYLAWLSWTAFLPMLGVIILGLFCYRGLFTQAFHFLKLAREQQDTLFGHFRGLTEGIKELRIHAQRRAAFFSQKIHPATEAFQTYNISASIRFIIAHAWNQLFFIILIGFALLALPVLKAGLTPEVVTGYILTILYVMGPSRQLMNNFPHFGRANIALRKVEMLGLLEETPLLDGNSVAQPVPVRAWKRLELSRVLFSYRQEVEDENFTLGPLDFALSPGELVFVVGGNGSGKSTFVKLLTGLYPIKDGEIRLDEQPITDQNLEWYRQHFSVVFSDFHLFEDLLGLDMPNLDARAHAYLEQLELEHKVNVREGVLSTIALSQGQRKRLALLTAYLEDRPIYVFDEWAADQDPHFKALFYTQLLPELKTRGKTVVVISHDDRYFHVADRLIKLDYGKTVVSDESPVAVLSDGYQSQRL